MSLVKKKVATGRHFCSAKPWFAVTINACIVIRETYLLVVSRPRETLMMLTMITKTQMNCHTAASAQRML